MKLAYIILNYNDYPSTENLLENIKDYSVIDLIVVVDNQSSDNSYQLLKKYKTKCKNKKLAVIQTEENKGFASGLNVGCRYAIKKLEKCNLILSNADIVIGSEDNLKELNSFLGKRKVDVVAPIITQKDGIIRGWRLPDIKTEILGNLPIIGKKLYKKRITYPDVYYKGELSMVGAVPGCFFMITSTLLEQLHFLDENTFLYYEEYILGKRLEKTKSQIAVANNITVFHNHSVSIDRSLNRVKKFKALKESQAYFCEQYLMTSKKDMFLLKLTRNLTLGLLYIRSFLHFK